MVPHVARKLRSYNALDGDAEQLLAAASSRDFRKVRARVDLLHQGENTGPMFILLTGWAMRYKTLEDGRRQILSVLLPGDMFDINGFMARFMDHSIASLTDLTLAALEDDFLEIARRHHPDLEKSIWCDLHVSAAIQREWSTSLGQRTARERLAHLMCELFVRQRASGLSDGDRCAFPLTQIELSDALGMTPVYVNRTLQDLRREGLIQLENKVLTIPDLQALQYLALFDCAYLRICEDGERASAGVDRSVGAETSPEPGNVL